MTAYGIAGPGKGRPCDSALRQPAIPAPVDPAMRIAEVAPPYLPVPPTGYGGIELIVAIRETQRDDNPGLAYAGVVPNGIDVGQYPLREGKEERLAFMGRCSPEKGPELAAEIARRARVPLTMVVKRAEPHEQRHWE